MTRWPLLRPVRFGVISHSPSVSKRAVLQTPGSQAASSGEAGRRKRILRGRNKAHVSCVTLRTMAPIGYSLDGFRTNPSAINAYPEDNLSKEPNREKFLHGFLWSQLF
jgi:hypothetical protein